MNLKVRLVTSVITAAALAVCLFVGLGRADLQAQNRKDFSVVDDETGHVALGLAIRKLAVSGTFMQAPAHPDDETNVLFAMYTHGWGLRSVDVQNNRGEGGQNEIGPELFRDMGVLRTSELLAAHRLDGAEQYFTRAIDYGYSFDPNEVIQRWGREDIVGDYVRLIRTLRPEVILTMNIQGQGGDRAHEATTVLAREAFRAAGDPTKYPEQLREGLRPWQAFKLYFAGGGGGGRGGPGGGGRGPGGGAPGGGAPGGAAPGRGAAAPTGARDFNVQTQDTADLPSVTPAGRGARGVPAFAGDGLSAVPVGTAERRFVVQTQDVATLPADAVIELRMGAGPGGSVRARGTASQNGAIPVVASVAQAGGGQGAGGGRGARGGGAAGGGAAAAGGAVAHVARVDTSGYDALLGRTYNGIAADARSNHKCQGVGGVPPLPGGGGGRGGGPGGGPGGGATFTLMDTTIPGEMDKDETSLFEGVDFTLAGLAKYAGANPPAGLVSGLAAVVDAAQRAKQAFDSGNDAGAAAPIESGLTALRALRAQLPSLGLSDSARYEIDFRLNLKEQDYQNAVLAAHSLSFQAVSDDGLIIGGQPVRVSAIAVNRGTTDVTISSVAVAGFDAPGACQTGTLAKDAVFSCNSTGTVPRTAKVTEPYFTDNYWNGKSPQAISIFDPSVPFGVPFAPTPFHVTFHVKAGSVDVEKDVAVEYRYVKDLYFGDKRMELNVVPAFSVQVTPKLAVFPAPASATATVPVQREMFVSVTNSTKGPADVNVALELPAGWKVTPASAPIKFEKEDESLSARFLVTAPAQVKTGDYIARAVVTSASTGDTKFSSGYQEIEYPHIQRRQVIKPAETSVKVIDVKIAPNVKVGYIMGVGDQVPPAIEQLGAKLTYIEQNDLAWGDLSKYDVIMTGVRAYERRADLRAYNRRLIDYANAGGTVIIQYNKTEFNQAQYGPFPAQVGMGRVTDETAPVKVLVPTHPVFNYPNKIGAPAWDKWVQERGLYFLGQKDPKYTDLVSMVDPFPDNPGEKLGSLVEAKVGRGRWVYLGLALWRQLPAGTTGAYQLMANIVSLPKAPVAAAAPAPARGAAAPATTTTR